MIRRVVQHSRRAALLLAVAFLLIQPLALHAQSPAAGTVTGEVEGPGNVPVPGARVILFDPETRSRKETWTDSAGRYAFEGVPAGRYRIVITLIGFRPSLSGEVDVIAGKVTRQNGTLSIAAPGESIPFRGMQGQESGRGSFAGRSRATQRRVPASSGEMREQQGGESEPQDLANIIGAGSGETSQGGLHFSAEEQSGTGEAEESQSISGSAGGAAGSTSSFLLTGNVVNATAPAMMRGRRRFVRFGGGGPAGSPFGGGGGGGRGFFFFSGGRGPRANQLRGNLFDSYTNSAFDARPFVPNAPAQPKEAFYIERAGFSLGGPVNIPKIYNGANKTNFFLHFDTTRAENPFNLFDSVPTLAERNGDFSSTELTSGALAGTVPTIFNPQTHAPFAGNAIPSTMMNSAALGLLAYIPQPNLPGQSQNYHVQGSTPVASQAIMGRVGEQFSSKDNFSAFYFYDSSHNHAVNTFPDITSQTMTRRQNLNLTETHTFNPHLVSMLSANFNRSRSELVNPFSFSQNIAGNLGILGVSADPIDWGLPSISYTNFTGLSDATPSLTRNQTIGASEFLIINHGNHNLHIGGGVSRIQVNTLVNPNAEGSFSFTGYSTSDFSADGSPLPGTGYDFADFLLGLPQTTSRQFGSSANYLRSTRYDAFGTDDWRTTDHLTLDLGVRWEYAAPFTEKYGRLADLELAPGFASATVVTGQNPGSLPAALLYGHPGNVSPRLGLAYRPWISHSLVVRAGYGIFYNESVYQGLVNHLVNQSPFATTSTLVSSPSQILTLEDGFPSVGAGVTRNTFAVDPQFLTPYAQSWNVMLEHDLSPTYILSAAYIGTRGTHLNLLLAPNIVIPSSSGESVVKNALPFEYETSGASSLYNGLRISLRHFSRHDFSFFLNYTYSKSMDNAASVSGTGGLPVQNPFDLQAEWALSNFNPTHSVRAFTRYQLPFGDHKKFLSNGGTLAKIFGNWSLSDITSYSSGTPYTAMLGGNLSNNVAGSAAFGGLRADATGLPVALPGTAQNTLEYFNTLAFALPPPGEYGDAGRDTIPGPPSLNFNVALDRMITISREKGLSADFRLATSNTFNIVNYEGLETTVNSNLFGRVNGAGAMRTLTLTARFRF